jgi:predicted metalloprotease with PDZ domain
MIREQTGDQKSLDDFMRRMYDRFGIPDRPYRTDDIAAVAGEVAGADLSDFFRRYVSGTEALPIGDCLHRMGFEGFGKPYAAEYFVFAGTAATPAEMRRRASMTAAY